MYKFCVCYLVACCRWAYWTFQGRSSSSTQIMIWLKVNFNTRRGNRRNRLGRWKCWGFHGKTYERTFWSDKSKHSFYHGGRKRRHQTFQYNGPCLTRALQVWYCLSCKAYLCRVKCGDLKESLHFALQCLHVISIYPDQFSAGLWIIITVSMF